MVSTALISGTTTSVEARVVLNDRSHMEMFFESRTIVRGFELLSIRFDFVSRVFLRFSQCFAQLAMRQYPYPNDNTPACHKIQHISVDKRHCNSQNIW